MGSQRVGQDWATELKWCLQCFPLGQRPLKVSFPIRVWSFHSYSDPPFSPFQGLCPYILFYCIPSMSFSAPDHSGQHTNKFCNLQNYNNPNLPLLIPSTVFFCACHSKFSQNTSPAFNPSLVTLSSFCLSNHWVSSCWGTNNLITRSCICFFCSQCTLLSATSDPTAQPLFGKLFSFGF